MPHVVTVRAPVAAAVALAVACVLSCAARRDLPHGGHWAPFVELARQAHCADQRNRLFEVDQTHVFWDRAGNCPDAIYSRTLYGQSPDTVLCSLQDSLAGPVLSCPVESFRALFRVMLDHLDQPDLGLGPGHTVRPILLEGP